MDVWPSTKAYSLDLVAAAYEGLIDMTEPVKAIIPAPHHELTIPAVGR